MPRQSAAVRPSPMSTANSHSSSKSERSSVPSTGSSAPASDSRLRAVTWHSPFPASSFKEARWSRSKENRPMCQSSSVSGMVVCNRMRIGLFIVLLSLYSETFLFQVVHIEPVIHHAIARDVLLDVVLHVFLQLWGQIAQAQVTFFIVPDDDVGAGALLGVLADPRGDLVVGRAGGDKRPVRVVVNLSELQPPLIERAVGVVFALPADEDGAALVHRASGQHIAAQRFARAARELFAVPQIAGQQFDFLEVFFHESLLLRFLADCTERPCVMKK